MSTGSPDTWRRRAATPIAASLSGLRALTPWALLVLAAVAAQLVPGVAAALEYRAGDALRAPWRLLTSHLAHFGGEHLAMDGAALLLLGSLARDVARRRLLGALLGAALAIPLALELADPAFASYRGLSGIDTALFALLLATRLRGAVARGRHGAAAALGALGLAAALKIALELVTQQAVFVDAAGAGFAPAPLAHAVGALAGVLAATLPRAQPRGAGASGKRLVSAARRHSSTSASSLA